MTPRPHAALVLWLIRERIANTWADLSKYFRLAPGRRLRTTLYRSVNTLYGNGLISISIERGSTPQEGLLFEQLEEGGFTFFATPHGREVLDTLGISLTELPRSDPHRRMIVEPSLRRAADSQYQSDILVFMPFSEPLRPVYDDHMKAVAKKLGQTIKRGDDFFTVQHIMADIWTALLETKLAPTPGTFTSATSFS